MNAKATERLTVAGRAWTELIEDAHENGSKRAIRSGQHHSTQTGPQQMSISRTRGQWRRSVLIVDTETTTDRMQRLRFGVYRYARWNQDGTLVVLEEGLFF